MTCVTSAKSSLQYLAPRVTRRSTNITAGTVNAARDGWSSSLINIKLSFNDVKLTRWALQVAASAVNLQSGQNMQPEDAVDLVAGLAALDERFLDQLHELQEEHHHKHPTLF